MLCYCALFRMWKHYLHPSPASCSLAISSPTPSCSSGTAEPPYAAGAHHLSLAVRPLLVVSCSTWIHFLYLHKTYIHEAVTSDFLLCSKNAQVFIINAFGAQSSRESRAERGKQRKRTIMRGLQSLRVYADTCIIYALGMIKTHTAGRYTRAMEIVASTLLWFANLFMSFCQFR